MYVRLQRQSRHGQVQRQSTEARPLKNGWSKETGQDWAEQSLGALAASDFTQLGGLMVDLTGGARPHRWGLASQVGLTSGEELTGGTHRWGSPHGGG